MRRVIYTVVLWLAVFMLFLWFVVEAVWRTTVGSERKYSRVRWRDLLHGTLTVEARDAE